MRKKNAVAPAALGLLLLLAWDAAARFGLVNANFLPAPAEVAKRAYEGLRDGYLASATWATLEEALLGASAAAAVGVPLGYALARWGAFARAVQPYIGASQAVPAVAVAPLLTIWIGYGTVSITVLCAIMVVFPMIVTTAAGISRVDADVLGALLDDPRAHAIAAESGPSAILRRLIPLWREHGTVRTDWSAEEQAAALELLLIGYFAAQTRTISPGMAEDRAGALGMSISAMLQASQPTKADSVPLASRVSDLLDEHAEQLQNAQAEHRRE